MAAQDLQSNAFPTFDERQLAELAHCAGAEPRKRRDGETLVACGECDFEFFVIKSGEIEVVDHSGDEPKPIAVLHAGQFTGDVSQLTGTPSIFSAVARGDCEVYEISPDELRGLLNRCPKLGDVILQAFIAR